MYSMGRGERPFAPTNYDFQPINQPDKNRMETNWNDYKCDLSQKKGTTGYSSSSFCLANSALKFSN